MANGQTNRKRYRMSEIVFRASTPPDGFRLVLCTSGSPPGDDTNTFAELIEIEAGNGYDSGGELLTPGETDFDVLVEDDGTDKAYVQIRDVEWIAAGGPIPVTGGSIRYAVLLDNNVTPASREVWDWWDFGGEISVPEGSGVLLRNLQMDIRKPI